MIDPSLIPAHPADILLDELPLLALIEPIETRHLKSNVFAGPGCETTADHAALSKQYKKIFDLMVDERWRTVEEIAAATGFPEESIGAQLRNMRKARFCGVDQFTRHDVPRRWRAGFTRLSEYRLLANRDSDDYREWVRQEEGKARAYFYAKHPRKFDIAL